MKRHICCNRKVKHKTLHGAKIAVRKLKEERGLIAYPYYCKRCKCYHVGKPSCSENPALFWQNLERKMEGEI